VFVWAPDEEGQFQPGRCSRWWLKQSLGLFQQQLRGLGSDLIIREGIESSDTLLQLARETGASALFFNHLYDPISLVRDHEVKQRLTEAGIECRSYNAGEARAPAPHRASPPSRPAPGHAQHCSSSTGPSTAHWLAPPQAAVPKPYTCKLLSMITTARSFHQLHTPAACPHPRASPHPTPCAPAATQTCGTSPGRCWMTQSSPSQALTPSGAAS
jgi:hypothetical protein